MLSVIGVLITCLIAIRLFVPSLIKNKHFRELYIFLVLLMVSTVTLVLDGFGIQIPNPFKVIEFIFKPIGTMIFGA